RVPAGFTVPADLTAALGSGSRASEEVAARGEALVLIDQQGKTQATIPIPGVATAFAAFQDGQNLALAAVIPGNPPRGTLYLRNPDGRLASLESAPGKIYHRLAAGKAGELFAATGKQVRAYAPGGRLTWTAHLDAAVTALAPAPRGGVFAAGSRQLILFDSTGSIAWRARLPGKVLGLAPAGEYLQVLGRDEIRVYRLAPRRSKGRAD
ncbi:MAG: PQQ-like beta-propeller repeat protein, partial [Actinobacteria bacterium]|nr:PQQ-like beta-propeller repeat protein [Actinomycetota bacterium]